MDTGIRPGALRKMKWKHISENTAISKEERKVWVVIDVPPENSKTGRYYRISAPVARYLEGMRKVSKHKKLMIFFSAINKQLNHLVKGSGKTVVL